MLKKSLIALSLSILLAPGLSYAHPNPPNEIPRTITVEGSATQAIIPNRAHVSFGVITEGVSVSEAKEKHDQIMNQVSNALYQLGIKKEYITTENYSISPIYTTAKDNKPAEIVKYQVSNTLSLSTTNMDILPSILENAIRAGANTVNDINFSADRSAALQDELLTEAVKNGKHIAQQITRSAGANIGKLISANVYESPSPQFKTLRASAVSANYDTTAPIYSGTQKVTVRVSLVFEII